MDVNFLIRKKHLAVVSSFIYGFESLIRLKLLNGLAGYSQNISTYI